MAHKTLHIKPNPQDQNVPRELRLFLNNVEILKITDGCNAFSMGELTSDPQLYTDLKAWWESSLGNPIEDIYQGAIDIINAWELANA